MRRRPVPDWLLGMLCVLLAMGALSGLVACKGAARALSRSGDDVARAVSRSGDDVARAGAGSTEALAASALARAGVRAAALPRHSSWLAWGTFDEHRPTGKGVLRFGIYESGSNKPVTTAGKVTVYSSRNQQDDTLIHSEEIPFTEGETAGGAVTKYSVASWRTWAGAGRDAQSVQFWVGMVIEAGGRRVPVAGETPPR